MSVSKKILQSTTIGLCDQRHVSSRTRGRVGVNYNVHNAVPVLRCGRRDVLIVELPGMSKAGCRSASWSGNPDRHVARIVAQPKIGGADR